MKALSSIPVLFIFIIFFTGCKQRTIPTTSVHINELSRQLEERPRENYKSSEAKFNSTYQVIPNKAEIADYTIAVKKNTTPTSKNFHPSTESKTKVNDDVVLLDKKQKIFSPKEFDKDNVFWRIGKVILKVGLTVMGLLGAISFGVSSNNGFLFSLFGGLLIGIIIMAISIPFFIIGLISELMKNKRSDLENTNEI